MTAPTHIPKAGALRVIAAALALAAGVGLGGSPGSAQMSPPGAGPSPLGAPALTVAGAALPDVNASLAPINLNISVQLQGDVPSATYVSARIGTSQLVQRTASGQWVPWDGRPETRIDNQFAAAGGNLTFVVTGADFSGPKFPVAVFIGYQTSAGLKFGYFTVTAKP
jgi:hypothetical protein